MDIYYKLNEQEIKNIIAEHFNTSHKNVALHIFQGIEGYGLNEETKKWIEADVRYNIKDISPNNSVGLEYSTTNAGAGVGSSSLS